MMKEEQLSNRDLVFTLLDATADVERRLDRDMSHIKGISLSEYRLLAALKNEHNQTATRVGLADAVGHTPSAVTRALRPLEKLGFVETKKDKRDARRSLATLTAAGAKLVNEASKLVDETVADLRALHALAAGPRQQIVRFLNELARS